MTARTLTATSDACPTKHRRTRAEMAVLRSALYASARDEQPVTCRRLFYVLVSAGLIAKTEGEYQRTVIRLVGEMREDGALPWNWIADHTRWMRKPRSFSSLSDALEHTAQFYRRSLWDEQADYVEVWCEKAGLAGPLYEVTSEWDVPLMICGGSPSKTFLREAAQQMRDTGKPAHVYYFGDHDPSGVAIRNRVARDLQRYYGDGPFGVSFESVAVEAWQIEAWGLPTRPTKTSDPNARKFQGESVEVDAIPTAKLRELARACIERHVDVEALERLQTVEAAERDTLTSLIRFHEATA